MWPKIITTYVLFFPWLFFVGFAAKFELAWHAIVLIVGAAFAAWTLLFYFIFKADKREH